MRFELILLPLLCFTHPLMNASPYEMFNSHHYGNSSNGNVAADTDDPMNTAVSKVNG